MSRYTTALGYPDLRELLSCRNADDLKKLLALLPDAQLKAPRKAELVEALALNALGYGMPRV
jgi:hypothetical protein